MRGPALFVVAAGVMLAGACSSSRTVVVAPEPRRAPPPPPPSQRTSPGPSTAATLGVPPGHLPDIGECRVWIPGVPPGQQARPKSRPCASIAAAAPAGSWIIYRPTHDKKLVHVRFVDTRLPGTVTIVRIFDLDSGRLMRETRPEDEPQDETRNKEKPNNQRPNNERPGYDQPGERPPTSGRRKARTSWTSLAATSLTRASAGYGFPARRPASRPSPSRARVMASRPARPRGAGSCTGPPQMRAWCTCG